MLGRGLTSSPRDATAAFSISGGFAAGRADACCSWFTDEIMEGSDPNGPHGAYEALTGMYGPTQSCKRKTKNGSWSAPMYSAFSGVSDSGP